MKSRSQPHLVRAMAGGAVTAVALAAAVATAPAQQVPGQLPRVPGAGLPSTAPSGPPAAPSPLLPASPQPSPSSSLAGVASPAPTGTGSPTAPAPGAAGAAAATAPGARAALVRFTGQLLDVRNGYVFFTTADAFKAARTLEVVDYDTGAPTSLVPAAPLFARATLDPASGAIVQLALTKRRLPTDAAYRQAYERAHAYVVTGSPKSAAPELMHGQRLTGRPVAVTFLVQVPPTTPFTDSVYLTTDASGWVPNAMKMDRIDALHYRLTRTYASGTQFAYRFTRGTWTSVEVGEDGLEDDAHQFTVPEVDAKSLTPTVYRWSDQNPGQPQVGPDSIPTPFNPNPFGNLPSTIQHPGVPIPSPTPRP